ncbi:MAG: trypsin-like peptidase domain-containing protein [Planctomycetaceae bacterium]|nr:trypsin-like peptidase domain-containing protein [Planctomycetaceae bacterium]
MMKQIKNLRSTAAIFLVMMVATAQAADNPRETPLVKAVKRARTAVVNIHSEKTATGGDALFGNGKNRKISGMGTGIIVDERGYIVTNHHVVNGVDSLRVTLHDGSAYTARTIAIDQRQDLAIIRIDPTGKLPVMPMGTSSDLMLGETVIAVGNAFGYEHTVTSGIVSSLSRDVEVNEKQSYENLIQTDASINPGNSGGPLLNLNGEVIGINVAIRAGAQRIGFAIPIDDARRVIARLISIERIDHNWHGLLARDVKQGAERQLVVQSASPDSPAAKAGFQPGDIVLRAGDLNVIDNVDLERALLNHTPGEAIRIAVRRNDETRTLQLELARRGPAPVTAESVVHVAEKSDEEETRGWQVLGMKLAPVSGQNAEIRGTRYRGGMRVTAVRSGSPAFLNGIRRGDILVGLHIWETVSEENITYVLDHAQFASFNPLKFYILRGGETLFGHLDAAAGN